MWSSPYTHHRRSREMKNRPDLSVMHGGVGPSAPGTHSGNMLHGEVNGDSENQTRTAFVRFFSFLFKHTFSPLPPLSRSAGCISWAAVGRIIRVCFYLQTSPSDSFVSRWPLPVWPFLPLLLRKKRRHHAWLQPTWITSTVHATLRRDRPGLETAPLSN